MDVGFQRMASLSFQVTAVAVIMQLVFILTLQQRN